MLTRAKHLYVHKADVLLFCFPYIGILQNIPLNIRQNVRQNIFTFKKGYVLSVFVWAKHCKQNIVGKTSFCQAKHGVGPAEIRNLQNKSLIEEARWGNCSERRKEQKVGIQI
jgi:hypothetical protein